MAPRPSGTAVSYFMRPLPGHGPGDRLRRGNGRGPRAIRKLPDRVPRPRRPVPCTRRPGPCGCPALHPVDGKPLAHRGRCGARSWHACCAAIASSGLHPRGGSMAQRIAHSASLSLLVAFACGMALTAPAMAADSVQAMIDAHELQGAYNPVLLSYLTEEGRARL